MNSRWRPRFLRLRQKFLIRALLDASGSPGVHVWAPSNDSRLSMRFSLAFVPAILTSGPLTLPPFIHARAPIGENDCGRASDSPQ